MYNDNRDLPPPPNGYVEVKKYRGYIESTAAAFLRFFPKRDIRVVDVGARDGYGVFCLRAHQYRDVLGVELIQGYVDLAQELGRNVVFDDWMDTKLPANSRDVVFSRHCIEHCRDGLRFFASCRHVLCEGGKVFLTCPVEGRQKFEKRKQKGNHMLCFSGLGDLQELAWGAGFKIQELGLSAAFGITAKPDEAMLIAKAV